MVNVDSMMPVVAACCSVGSVCHESQHLYVWLTGMRLAGL